jgi:hypothetical protein
MNFIVPNTGPEKRDDFGAGKSKWRLSAPRHDDLTSCVALKTRSMRCGHHADMQAGFRT